MSYFDYRVGGDAISSTLSFLHHAIEHGIRPKEAMRHERTTATGKTVPEFQRLKHSEDKLIEKLFDQGHTQAEVARMLGRHKSTIHYWKKRNGRA